MAIKSKAPWCLVFVAALLGVAEVQATAIQIDINTGPLGLGLNGTNWDLAFDLNNGNPQANSVTIKNFSIPGGALTPDPTFYPNSGNVTGTLPGTVILDDSVPAAELFNEYTHNANLGTAISFLFEITGLFEAGSDPDTFSFYLIDPLTGFTLETTDPTGAFFVYSIGNEGQPTLFQPLACPQGETCVASQAVPDEPSDVPEPGALALMMAGLFALGLMRSIRNPSLSRG